MNIPVLVEPLPNKGFRAISGEPLNLKTEAPTREEAICKMRELIERRVANGAEVVSISIGAADHPLAEFAGMSKGDPLLEPWKRAMADYRKRRDPGQE